MQLTQRFVQVHRQVFYSAARLWADNVRTPAVTGEAFSQPSGHQKGGIAPQVMVVLAVNRFVVAETAHRVFQAVVRGAQQKAWQGGREVFGVFHLAQAAPFGVSGAFKDVADFLDRRQVLKAFEVEELRPGGHHKGRMGHRPDAGDITEQLDVRGRRPEGVVTNHRSNRFAAELTVTGGVHMLVQAAAGDITGIVEVFEQLILGDVQHIQFDVLAKVRTVHQQLEPAPGRFQLLKLRLMEDLIHLLAQGTVNFSDHLIDPKLVHGLVVITAVQNFADKRRHPLLRDRVAFLGGVHQRIGQ